MEQTTEILLLRKDLRELPSAEPEVLAHGEGELVAEPEREKGEWIPQDYNRQHGMVTTTVYYYPACSQCGHVGNYEMNFCPNCGADMRGEQDG